MRVESNGMERIGAFMTINSYGIEATESSRDHASFNNSSKIITTYLRKYETAAIATTNTSTTIIIERRNRFMHIILIIFSIFITALALLAFSWLASAGGAGFSLSARDLLMLIVTIGIGGGLVSLYAIRMKARKELEIDSEQNQCTLRSIRFAAPVAIKSCPLGSMRARIYRATMRTQSGIYAPGRFTCEMAVCHVGNDFIVLGLRSNREALRQIIRDRFGMISPSLFEDGGPITGVV